MFVDILLRSLARASDFRVGFVKLAPSRDFETNTRAVKETIGSHFHFLISSLNHSVTPLLDKWVDQRIYLLQV